MADEDADCLRTCGEGQGIARMVDGKRRMMERVERMVLGEGNIVIMVQE